MLKAKKQYEFGTHDHIIIDIDPSEDLTQQHFEKECNINSIVGKYQKTGVLPTAMIRDVQFGEVGPDLLNALSKVRAAEEQFLKMPSTIREHFQNNPEIFMRFLCDKDNYSKAVKLGIVEERKVEKTEKDYLKEISEKVQKNGLNNDSSKSSAGNG